MNEVSKEVFAVETHEKAKSYYNVSEQYAYKFFMEIQKIRDEKLFLELGCDSFAEYTNNYFGYDSDTVNLRIQDATNWQEGYAEALRSYGKHKTRQLGLLPTKERENLIENGVPTEKGIKPIDEATTREIEAYKKQLKAKDEQIEMQARMIENLNEQEPQVVEKEVIPEDYERLKTSYEALEERSYNLEASYRELLKERQETDEKSLKYEQLSQAINQAKGQLNQSQQMISNYKNLSDLLKKSNEFLSKASALIYQDLSEVLNSDGLARQELDFLIDRTETFVRDLKKLTKNNILEGEIINE